MYELSEEDIEFIISEICSCDSVEESTKLYRNYEPILPDCKFIFASANGTTPGFAVNRSFSNGAVVHSLFNTPKVWVLDRETATEMKSGRSTFQIDYSISLDSQALSYLEPYLKGNLSRLPKDFVEVFRFISRDEVFVDPIPYTYENLHNLTDKGDKIYEKLKAYEVLRSLDVEALEKEETVQSTLSEAELNKKAQEHIARMHMKLCDEVFMKALTFRQQFVYCCLLKMVLIQFKQPKTSTYKKVIEFIEFCDMDIATLPAREIALAKRYFDLGTNLPFFGKIQKNKTDTLDVLDGMAWDLWHLRQMEESITVRPNSDARYFFPALLTFDKAFIDVLNAYPLKACAYVEGQNRPMPFYNGNWFELISDDENVQNELLSRFYSQESKSARNTRRDILDRNISGLVRQLESELITFMKKTPEHEIA
ncbi:hypothetical protein FBY02_11532 [Pseudomonas sp. SJZ078]|uniref:hypothetical protein n=1 Tax=Pseudomonas sp. SJZ078 TaxID=2572886 RepID=UPI0011A0D021|nr:hypothetical protein [Pseudomonas sp. SJZ078]TWC31191.1 hypothetical protein FBY02_11532 [Pseudomonas sp. SJZ078]